MSSPSFEIKNKAIRAGAGAGKTYNLTHEVLRFAQDFFNHHQRWPKVVVTTFTRKATQELQERLLEMALLDHPEVLPFVSSSSFLKVSTIHGLLDEFLKEFGAKIGLKSDFTYLTRSEAQFLSKKVLKDMIEEDQFLDLPLFTVFSFAQIHRLLCLATDEDMPSLKPVTKRELNQWLEETLMGLQKKILELVNRIGTYSLPEKWQETKDILSQIAKSLTLKQWADSAPILELIEKLELRGHKTKKMPDSELIYDDYKELLEELRNLDHPSLQVRSIENLSAYNEQFKKVFDIYHEKIYQAKMASSKIEMNDLEILSLHLIRQKEISFKAWSQSKDYWLIDEFQDTSPRQLEILTALIDSKPYYLVGDPQQSIYLFRGARSEVFVEKFSEVASNNGETLFLDKNYRSQPQVLNFINYSAQIFGENFATMTVAKEETPSENAALEIFVADDIDEENTGRQQELYFLKKSLLDLKNQGIALENVAILVRKNSDLEDVGQYLAKHKIPAHLHSSGLFWQRREVRSAICLLKFLINPHDDENLMILLRSPLMTITDQQMVQFAQQKSGSLWAHIEGFCVSGELLRSGTLLHQFLSNTHKYGVAQCFEEALMDLGFFDFHLQYDPTGRAEGNLWKFVYLVKNFERERGAQLIQFVNDCERAIRLEASVDSPGSVETNKVNVMTVHASKGLQFDYVFLPFLGQKPYKEHHILFAVDEIAGLWSIRAPANETEVKSSSSLFEKKVLADFHRRQDEEDLRVLYVALTRAVAKIYLSWSEPLAKPSWAEYFCPLVGEPSPEKFDFSFRVFKTQDLQVIESPHFRTKAEVSIPDRFLDWKKEDLQIQTHSVTKMVSRGNKSYRDAYIKKQQGILFHKLLEIIKYPVSKDVPALLEKWFPNDQDEVLAALNYSLVLQEPPLVELMKHGQVEWSFRYREESKVIDGQVDLWSVFGDELWVVDYKSGEKILLEKSFSQLEIYSRALKGYLNWSGSIKAAVIYPFLQTTFVRQL